MRTASIALGLVALLVLVALGSAGGDWGGGIEQRRIPSGFVDAAYTVGILIFVAIAALVLWALRGPGRWVRPEKPRGFALAGFVLWVFVVVLWVRIAKPKFLDGSGDAAGTPQTPTLREPPEGIGDAPGPQFQWWIAAGALLALAAIILNERRRRGVDGPRATAAEELEDVLTQTLDELEAELDTDPRRAVIQAYARMERVLGQHGHGRLPHEAPLEYLGRILRELEVRATAAHALTELFERAKFSRHEIDWSMRVEAVASLEAVRDDLRAAA